MAFTVDASGITLRPPLVQERDLRDVDVFAPTGKMLDSSESDSPAPSPFWPQWKPYVWGASPLHRRPVRAVPAP